MYDHGSLYLLHEYQRLLRIYYFKRRLTKASMALRVCNPSTVEVEAG